MRKATMNIWNRVLAMLLVLVMVVSLIPSSVFATEATLAEESSAAESIDSEEETQEPSTKEDGEKSEQEETKEPQEKESESEEETTAESETTKKLSIVLEPSKTNTNSYYTDDFTVNVTVNVAKKLGISSAKYAIYASDSDEETIDKTQLQWKDLVLSSDKKDDKLDANYVGTIPIKAKAYNKKTVKLFVEVKDSAENTETKQIDFKICTEKPQIAMSVEDTTKEGHDANYYVGRELSIMFTDREDTFDQNAAEQAIQNAITITDKEKNEQNFNGKISWSESDDKSMHTATVELSTTGKYTISEMKYSNRAGLEGEGTVADTLQKFTILENKLTGTISKTKSVFPNYYYDYYEVTDAKDALGEDVKSIGFYKCEKEDEPIQKSELAKKPFETPKDGVYQVSKFRAGNYTIYARLTDKAGNVSYINTEEICIPDQTAPTVTIGVNDPKGTEIYNQNVTVEISVDDAHDDSGQEVSSSGIQSIHYWVICEDAKWENGKWVSKETITTNETIKIEKEKYSDSVNFTIDAAKNNSSNVYVYVEVTDCAGNITKTVLENETADTEEKEDAANAAEEESDENAGKTEDGENAEESNAPIVKKIEPLHLDIDVTAPKVHIQYDNNEATNETYFKKTRTATITVTERSNHFDRKQATNNIHITAKDAKDDVIWVEAAEGNEVALDSILKSKIEWKTTEGATPDDATHTATITYDVDANYTFDFYEGEKKDGIAYTDKAGNFIETKEIGVEKDSIAVNEFTIDRNKPEASFEIEETEYKTFLGEIYEWALKVFWNRKPVTITATVSDQTSPVSLYYYKDNKMDHSLTEKELNDLLDWKSFETDRYTLKVNADEQFIFYLKAIDKAGNVTYVSSEKQILDTTPCEVTLTPSKANANNCYNADVPVNLEVNDKGGSGIQKIEYWIIKKDNDVETVTKDAQILYNLEQLEEDGKAILRETNWESGEKTVETYPIGQNVENLPKQSWKGSILVDAEENNSSNVYVYVEVTDCAGNITKTVLENETADTEEKEDAAKAKDKKTDKNPAEIEDLENAEKMDEPFVKEIEPLHLDIDVTAPKVHIQYDNNEATNETYFKKTRTATITVTERSNHFDSVQAINNIDITSKDVKGNVIMGEDAEGNEVGLDSILKSKIKWKTTEGATPDDATHTATITYDVDANYTFDFYEGEKEDGIVYTDKAGNSIETKEIGVGEGTIAVHKFTVDTAAPYGTITGKSEEGREVTWSDLEDNVTFGFWSGKKITITGTSGDETSPIVSTQYYKTDRTDAMTKKELKNITSWKKFTSLVVEPNEQFVIYLRIEDKAGHVSYISTDGMIVDNTAPREEIVAPEITVKPEQPINGFYNRDVKVNIKVVDPTVGNTWSGLKTVRYRVLNMGKETQSGVLYSLKKENPKRDELKNVWTDSIIVDSRKNNSNDVKVIIYAQDNALNSSKSKIAMKIDITAPTIQIRYNNNNPDSGKYYSKDRVATITVTERNFRAQDVKTVITNTDGVIPEISGWTTVKGTGNGDNTKHIAKIHYHADGDYTFRISYTDRANNRCRKETYARGTTNPQEFTIDQTLPVVSVGYSNNAAANGSYFKKARTASITIQEHNFDVSRVTIKQTAALDGKKISTPGISWSHRGDTHTATIVYNKDGDYTFDISMLDMAGNQSKEAGYGNSKAGKKFTVDTTIAKPKVTGIGDGKAYADNVTLAIAFSDINFDSDSIKLVRTRKDEKNVDVTKDFIKNSNRSKSRNGISVKNVTFAKNKENDGIYTLTAIGRDKAGNEAKQKITFTINRFGSVYTLDDYLSELKGSYKQEIEKALVITEYNPNKLADGSLKVEITHDMAPLSNVNYTVTPATNTKVKRGESGWYEYKYTIDPSNFTEDGIYKIRISSKDSAGNLSESQNFEECNIVFHLDTTNPKIEYIEGLENDVINAEKQEVRFKLFDSIGLKKVTVYVDGKEKLVLDQFDDPTEVESSITLTESDQKQHIQFTVEDLAEHKISTDDLDEKNEYVFQPSYAFERDVIVSTNGLVRLKANLQPDKPLFTGAIVGIAGVAALLILFFVFKKRGQKTANVQSEE